MRKLLPLLLVALPLTLTQAHHSPARFSDEKTVNVSGVVTEVSWRNPHVYFSVADEAGRTWLLEANATTNMERNGWPRDLFEAGDVVFFEAMANVDPAKTHVALLSMAGQDGMEHNVRIMRPDNSENRARPSASSLAGIWSGDPKLAFGFLFSSLDHPVTEKARLARERYDESMDPAAACVVWPSPRLVAWNAFYPIKVDVTDRQILFTSEYGETERVIYLDGRQHPPDGKRTNQGHSIGHWDGDVLVVDTRLFADHRSPIADGIPSGAQKHVVERYALSEDGTEVKVDIWQDDPEYLAEPLTGQLSWRYAPDMAFAPFACDPEAARRFVQ